MFRVKVTNYDAVLPDGATSLKVPMPLDYMFPVAGWDIDKCEVKNCDYMWHGSNNRHFSLIPVVQLYGKGLHKIDEKDHGYETEQIFYRVS